MKKKAEKPAIVAPTLVKGIKRQEKALRETVNPLVVHVRPSLPPNKRKNETDDEYQARLSILSKIPRDYTIAGVVKNKKLHIGYAVCSSLDNFDKAKARLIATSRAVSKPVKTMSITVKGKKDKLSTVIGKALVKYAYAFHDEMPHLFDKEAGIEYNRELSASHEV